MSNHTDPTITKKIAMIASAPFPFSEQMPDDFLRIFDHFSSQLVQILNDK